MSTIIQAKSIDAHWNYQATLPYGLKTTHVSQAVADTYNFFYKVNALLIREGFDFFENLILGNTFSGMLSELLVKNIAKHCPSLARNAYVGGHPDLILTGKYTDDEILRGSDGIEVKTSRQRGGWQAHNPEECWVLIFRYTLGDATDPPERREPMQFVQILAAELIKDDWALAERGEQSRRTRTTSITTSGMQKLRLNPVYQDPRFIVAPNQAVRKKYRALHKHFKSLD